MLDYKFNFDSKLKQVIGVFLDNVKRKITIKYGIFEEISEQKLKKWAIKTEKYITLNFPIEKAGLTAAILVFGAVGFSRKNYYTVEEILDDFNAK